MMEFVRGHFAGPWGRIGGNLVATASILVVLGACASSADPKAMIVKPQANEKPFAQPLQQAMCVRNVSGGEKTNPLWASKVDDDGFKAALSASIDGAGLTAKSDCGYPIDVNLLGLSQPTIGFDMTVTSHVNYKVYDRANEPILLETVDAPFTATVSDAFVGVERLKLANEGSIRLSIQKFLDKLREWTPKGPAPAGAALGGKDLGS